MEATEHRVAGYRVAKHGRRGAAFFVLAALLACVARTGVAEETPSPESILDKRIEAMGGRDAMKKVTNRVMKGELQIAAMGLTGSLKNYQDAKSRTRLKVEFPGFGVEESGFDGKVAWHDSMMTGTRVKEGEELAAVKRDAYLFPEVHWKTEYKTKKLVGSEKVDEHDCWKLELTPEVGSKRTVWIDKKSNLTRQVQMTEASPMGEIESVATMSDYRAVDGIQYPFHVKNVSGGGMQTIILEIKSVKHNQELADDFFALPDSVKTLLAAEAKTGG